MIFDTIHLPERAEPLVIAWPAPDHIAGFLEFPDPESWRSFIRAFGIHPLIPLIVQTKFRRAQLLYLLGWIDHGLVKAGELAALIALELALTDRYGGLFPKRQRSFAALLDHLVTGDGLTDGQIPIVAGCGGTAIGHLTGAVHPTLAERRNGLAHGDPFEGPPVAGLLELARDLINFAYRDYISQGEARGIRT